MRHMVRHETAQRAYSCNCVPICLAVCPVQTADVPLRPQTERYQPRPSIPSTTTPLHSTTTQHYRATASTQHLKPAIDGRLSFEAISVGGAASQVAAALWAAAVVPCCWPSPCCVVVCWPAILPHGMQLTQPMATGTGSSCMTSFQVSLSCGGFPAFHVSHLLTSLPHTHKCTPTTTVLTTATIIIHASASRPRSSVSDTLMSINKKRVSIRA